MKSIVLRHVLSRYGRDKVVLFAVFCEIVRTVALRVLTVIVVSDLVSSLVRQDFEMARQNVYLHLIVFVVGWTIGVLGDVVAIRAENRIYDELNGEFYLKLTNKDMQFYRDNHTGHLVATYRQYLDSSILISRMIRNDIIRVLISLTVPIIILATRSWQIGVATIVFMIVQLFYTKFSSKRINIYRHEAKSIYGKISAVMADNVTNILAYRSTGRQAKAEKDFFDLRVVEKRIFNRRHGAEVVLDFPRQLFNIVLTTVVFLIIINMTKESNTSINLIVLTLTYLIQIGRNIQDVPDIMKKFDDLSVKLETSMDVLNAEYEKIKDPKHPQAFPEVKIAIEFKDVTFVYEQNNTKILDNFNLKIEAGKSYGIVGLSGAGKSTFANLLMRFDDITGGSIVLNGVDLKDFDQNELRRNIAYVPQEPMLLHTSIKENIALHFSKIDLGQIEQVAKVAHADEFIDKLPKKYDTLVGERGVKLSGGQKQRVAIARALLKNAPIVLFDEATSALDSHSEALIKAALPTIIKDTTAMIIAHRLSTIADLDQIIVMSEGKIIEQGTHQELVSLGGEYAKLWAKQSRSE